MAFDPLVLKEWYARGNRDLRTVQLDPAGKQILMDVLFELIFLGKATAVSAERCGNWALDLAGVHSIYLLEGFITGAPNSVHSVNHFEDRSIGQG